MQPGITVITPGVDDLEVSLRFYRDGLGLATPDGHNVVSRDEAGCDTPRALRRDDPSPANGRTRTPR